MLVCKTISLLLSSTNKCGKFADYGLAKKLNHLGEQQIRVGGTPHYWHPEIDKAYRENRSFCMIDPFEADLYSIKQALKEAGEWHQQKSHTTMEQVKNEFICYKSFDNG